MGGGGRGGVQLLAARKLVNRPGWWKRKFASFQMLTIVGEGVHRIRGFGIVNKEEVDFFSGILFLNGTTGAGTLISCSYAFPKSSLNIWNFLVHILLKPFLENFEHYFASV